MTNRRRKGRKIGKHYFTKVHEDAIIEYVNTDDQERKTELYVTLIQPALSEMVDKIVYTYKFTTLPNCDDLREECKIWLTTILDKFDPEKNSKAFSYFSVVTKNWFIHKVKRQSFRRSREIQYCDLPKSIEQQHMSAVNPYIPEREKSEFWDAFKKEMETWGDGQMKENEERVYRAIQILFESSDDIEIFNKKAVYLYLRELTDLNTKQVVNNLNKFREKYRAFKKEWDDGKL